MIWRQPNGQQFYAVALEPYWAARAAMKARTAKRKLQRIVDEKRESYEVRRYREKREAALKGRARA